MAENKNDFRYAVGPSKVPWTAVGEYYNADDVKEFVKFLLPDKEGKPGGLPFLLAFLAAMKKSHAVPQNSVLCFARARSMMNETEYTTLNR